MLCFVVGKGLETHITRRESVGTVNLNFDTNIAVKIYSCKLCWCSI